MNDLNYHLKPQEEPLVVETLPLMQTRRSLHHPNQPTEAIFIYVSLGVRNPAAITNQPSQLQSPVLTMYYAPPAAYSSVMKTHV